MMMKSLVMPMTMDHITMTIRFPMKTSLPPRLLGHMQMLMLMQGRKQGRKQGQALALWGEE
jgi:hypothetical protein